ncbi:MAG TPA: hypothetical protein VKF38_08010 [Anaerolineaceae bacterium]|nr:hypothetical protein [Anaerolineaceae bacterium]
MPQLNSSSEKPILNASITISRKSFFGGAAIPFNIIIDGVSVGKVDNGKTVNIPFSSGLHKIYIKVPVWNRNNHTDEILVDLTNTQNIKFICGYKAPNFVFLQKV